MNPSTDNYTLGRGILSFNKLAADGVTYEGERDLGNAPDFTLSVALETLEHFSSRSGLKSKDKKVITQITPTINFTLDEISDENLALLLMGSTTEVQQAASASTAAAQVDAFSTIVQGRYYELTKRSVGGYLMAFTGVAGGTPARGDTVTGASSSSTCNILATDGSTWMIVDTISAAFTDDEGIGDGTWTATMTGNIVFTSGRVVVTDGATTVYDVGDDYLVDAVSGRVLVVEGGAITGGSDIEVEYANALLNYTEIRGLAQTNLEGMLRFVSDKQVGQQMEIQMWRVSLTPSGDTAMIGDDWSTLSFDGEILKDETGHPTSPYLTVTIEA